MPDDKDDPRMGYMNPDGTVAPVRIESGEGRKCEECNCDLGGKYYLHEDGEYRCEEHWVTYSSRKGITRVLYVTNTFR